MLPVSASSSSISMAGIATAAVGLGTLAFLLNHRKEKGSDGKMPRNMSFTSATMCMGCYPSEVNQPEPNIHVAMYFETCPIEEHIVEYAIKPMLAYDRLSMIPVGDKQGTLRMPSSPLDPRQLVRKMEVSKTEELYTKIQEIFNDPLTNNSKRGDLPWFEFVILENKGKGPSICLWRVHHGLGDGISLAELAVRHVLKAADGKMSPLSGTNSYLPPRLMSKKSSLEDDRRTQFTWTQRLWQILDSAQQVFLLPFTPYDDPTVFSQACKPGRIHSRQREIILLPKIPLSLVQVIKNTAKVTVNDVIFTCLSQAIYDYLQQENCSILREKGTKLQCRALLAAAIPRSMKETTTHDLLQNKWFLVSSDMGVGCSPSNDILERLEYIHQNFLRLKASPLAMVGMNIQNHILKHFPVSINRQGVYDSILRHTMTVSNVPGPRQRVVFANKEILEVQMFFSNLCTQVGIISYNGQIYGNMVIDPDTIPNGQSLKPLYLQAMVKLAQRLNVPLPVDITDAAS